jgi:hypothetical protein
MLDYRKKIYINKGKNPSYYIKVTGTQVPKLYHYLYDDVPESQYLGRKHKLFSVHPESPVLKEG